MWQQPYSFECCCSAAPNAWLLLCVCCSAGLKQKPQTKLGGKIERDDRLSFHNFERQVRQVVTIFEQHSQGFHGLFLPTYHANQCQDHGIKKALPSRT